MRVLLCPAQRHLGVDRGSELAYPFHFAASLAKKGHQSTMVVGEATGISSPDQPIAEVFGRTRSHPGAARQILRTATFPWLYSREGQKLIRNGDFDVLHHFLPFGRYTFSPMIMRRSVDLPKVVGPIQFPPRHSFDEFDEWLGARSAFSTRTAELGFWGISPFLKYLNRKTLESVDAMVASNHATLQVYERLAPRARHFVIPIGVNTDHFSPRPTSPTKRDFTFLFVGRLLPRKGVRYLIEAFNQIAGNRDVRLAIGGIGPMETHLRRAVWDHGLEQRVDFIGRVDQSELPAVYAKADVVVNPTLYEPFSTVNLEAMACGRPVISTRIPGMDDLVPSTAGVLVQPRDAIALGRAMSDAAANPTDTERKGTAARDHVVANYSWDLVAEQWSEVYATITGALLEA